MIAKGQTTPQSVHAHSLVSGSVQTMSISEHEQDKTLLVLLSQKAPRESPCKRKQLECSIKLLAHVDCRLLHCTQAQAA